MKSDTQIRRDVQHELQWDTRIDATAIAVAVERGTVQLTGKVSSYAAKLAAQEAAHHVANVLDVANDIEVEIPASLGRSDTEIARAVRETLDRDALLPSSRIQSTVSNGWITLTGSVDNWREKEDAGQLVRRLTGVRGVSNEIAVVAPESDPGVVRRAIEIALRRHGHGNERQVQISVDGAIVTVSGSVHDWAEKFAVMGAVGHAPGVRAIADHLRVEPSDR